MGKIARVILDSPLPSLDKLFDYQVGADLEDLIRVGQRVRVNFGRSKALQDAFVIEVADSSEFVGKLSSISQLVSSVPLLPSNIYTLLRTLADRQASTVGDTLGSAIPQRFVRVEKKFIADAAPLQSPRRVEHPAITAILARPTQVESNLSVKPLADWIVKLLDVAYEAISSGLSAILLVPDYRDQKLLRDAIASTDLKDHYLDFSSDQTGSKRYEASLSCLTEGTHLVVGSRSALFAPLQNLGVIAIYDDGDSSFQDQQSPYAHARDIALIRQVIDGCSLRFVAHARSSEVQRLIDINYITEITNAFVAPKVAFDETNSRVSTLAWQAIREAAETGAVLVQVGSRGVARTAYCQECSTRALCMRCNGPLWIDATATPRCRWCNAQNLAYTCSQCKSQKLRQGYGGSTRTVAEFGAAFPGLQLIESTGDNKVLSIEGKRKIVISTPGAEPEAAGGYAAVVILDAAQALNRDSLRASEEAVREWSNAIAKMSSSGRAVIVGIPSHLGQRLALWQQADIAKDELESRRELNFPPHLRLGSIEGPIGLISALVDEVKVEGVEFLGPITVRSKTGDEEQRLVIKYPYSAGAQLADALRAAQLKLTAGSTKTGASGRVSRAIRLRMDDPEVI